MTDRSLSQDVAILFVPTTYKPNSRALSASSCDMGLVCRLLPPGPVSVVDFHSILRVVNQLGANGCYNPYF
jgi:hypothetical protein